MTCASKNTAYWQLLSGRGILCSLEPLVCEWNFPAVHKNTQTTSRAHLWTSEKSESRKQPISVIRADWPSLNTPLSWHYEDQIVGKSLCANFHPTWSASSPHGLLLLHVFFCVQGFALSTWIWLKKCGVIFSVIFIHDLAWERLLCQFQGTRHKNNK